MGETRGGVCGDDDRDDGRRGAPTARGSAGRPVLNVSRRRPSAVGAPRANPTKTSPLARARARVRGDVTDSALVDPDAKRTDMALDDARVRRRRRRRLVGRWSTPAVAGRDRSRASAAGARASRRRRRRVHRSLLPRARHTATTTTTDVVDYDDAARCDA